ncbi:MAG: TetR/AcrR family transcriptional regulator [Candidatus Saccharibacteria bacterium]|nr:TetR/AcrR family transcriptional regulator [Moraxellaceae bacterium]
MSTRKTSKQEDILDTATSLFSEFGYHAVGIDRIIAESTVAKMTLYKHFPSKDFLIESVLVRRDEQLRESIINNLNQEITPLLKLKSIFDWYSIWFQSEDFHGCMFIKATEEFSDVTSNIRRFSQDHKIWITDLMSSLLLEVGVKNPDAMAAHLIVILDGLTVQANMFTSDRVEQINYAWRYVEFVAVNAPSLS